MKADIFHDFHHALVEQIQRDLNAGTLPLGYYAIAEQTDPEHDRLKQCRVSIRHVIGHRIVAAVEVVSPGNRATRQAIEQFTRTAADFLSGGSEPMMKDRPGLHGASPRMCLWCGPAIVANR